MCHKDSPPVDCFADAHLLSSTTNSALPTHGRFDRLREAGCRQAEVWNRNARSLAERPPLATASLNKKGACVLNERFIEGLGQGTPQRPHAFPARSSAVCLSFRSSTTTMMFSRSPFAVLLAVAAVGVKGSHVESSKPLGSIRFCTDYGFNGTCYFHEVPGGGAPCIDLRLDNDTARSFGSDPGIACVGFK